VQSIALVGTGSIGTALALRIQQQGVPPSLIVSRALDSARHLAEASAGTDSGRIERLASFEGLVCLCVPDGVLETLARELAALREDWSSVTLMHFSGVQGVSVLQSLSSAGAGVVAFHPAQSFPPNSPPERFDGAYCVASASPHLHPVVEWFSALLGTRVIFLEEAARPAYHLACSIVSNYTVVLQNWAEDTLTQSGVALDELRPLLVHLLKGTAANLETLPPQRALTGPVARADTATIRSHLDVLGRQGAEAEALYLALARRAAEMALNDDRYDEEQVRQMRVLLGTPGKM
jgi:predicted short-subunit dehydrogenase-like oxidoreductase (DUF2520 family)